MIQDATPGPLRDAVAAGSLRLWPLPVTLSWLRRVIIPTDGRAETGPQRDYSTVLIRFSSVSRFHLGLDIGERQNLVRRGARMAERLHQMRREWRGTTHKASRFERCSLTVTVLCQRSVGFPDFNRAFRRVKYISVASAADRMQAARAELHRVLQSEAFRNSESLRHLLAYLGEKSLVEHAEELKEYTIGIEACGKPPSYDPQKDASVRVQMGRLRQKLDEYYRGEGAADALVLDLPKGRFVILCHPRGGEPRARRSLRQLLIADIRWLRSIRPVTAILCLLLIAAVSWAIWLTRRLHQYDAELAVTSQVHTMHESSPLWGPFLSHSVPTVAVFGSPPFFASGKHGLFVRFFNLKNPDDPQSSPDFAAANAGVGPLLGPRYDYASMGDAVAVQRLTAFFGSAGLALRALPAHLAVWDSIKDAHLIFVGAWRMHPQLRRLPVTQDFELGADDQIYNRRPQPGEQQVYTTPSHRNTMTYAVVGAFAGLKPGREVLVLTAHSSPGAVAAADFITTPETLRVVQNRIGLSASGSRKHFQMLLRIHVDNDVPVKTEYVTHHLTASQ